MIGAGGHSRAAHLPALAELRDEFALELVGVADPRHPAADDAAREFGFERGYASAESLLAERLDACLVLTPTPTVPELARLVVGHGVPCLVEKPFAASSAEGESLVAELSAAAPLVMVSANRRFDPAFTGGLDWLGGIVPTAAIGVMARSARSEPDFVYNTGVHLVDAFGAAAGSPLTLAARRSRDVAGALWADALVTAESGCSGSLAFAPTAGAQVEELRLLAAERSVHIRFGATGDAGYTAWEHGQVVSETSTAGLAAWEREGTLAETAAFLAAVRSGAPSPVPLATYLHSMRLAEQLNGPLAGAVSRD